MTSPNTDEVRLRIMRGRTGDNSIIIRVSAETFDKIVAQAKRQDRSVARMAEMLLKEAIASREAI